MLRSVRTDECVTDDERQGGNHALTPDAGGDHGGLTDITFHLSPTLCYVFHTGRQHSALYPRRSPLKSTSHRFFFPFSLTRKTRHKTPSHLFPAKIKIKVLEVSQAFVGEAGAA